MPEQALIPAQLFISAPSWECGHLVDVGAQDKVAPSQDGAIRGDDSPTKELREGVLAQCRSRQDKIPSKILRGQGKALWPTPSGCCTHLEQGVIKG